MSDYVIENYIINLHIKNNIPIKFKVKGNSMLPLIKNNDIIEIVKNDLYKLGDIVLYKYYDLLIVHRIIKIKVNQYYLKGDNGSKIDIIDKINILGKMKGNDDKNINIKKLCKFSFNHSKYYKKNKVKAEEFRNKVFRILKKVEE